MTPTAGRTDQAGKGRAHVDRSATPAEPALRTRPGRSEILGATWDGAGTNFAVFSSEASQVDLCLFVGGRDTRIALPDTGHGIWCAYVPGIGPGTQYGYRVHGRWDSSSGRRFNPDKLLLDPYARQVMGSSVQHASVLPYIPGTDGSERSHDDSALWVPRSVVIDARFEWAGDTRPRRPLSETVIYEMHVKGFTARHPDIPESIRGSYAALAHPAALEHLQRLGVTAVELLPVQAFIHDSVLLERGLRNYWGYNTIGFFAPHADYASPEGRLDPTREFKTMVAALHAAGIEVILDVVYNHTAEGNHLGPMLSFRGFDNAAYYRLVGDDPSYYHDYTGTGNTLNICHPQALRVVLDSLRYWVTEMHVDGFRFDLAVSLGRGSCDFDARSAFFTAIYQDPVLQGIRLIAEPWDVGHNGYRLGEFPDVWAEWNGRYRDGVRDFWRSLEGSRADFATRLSGSDDLFKGEGRRPQASINIITTHDGFTLADLVSYNDKHNEGNGEGNQDGEANNHSWNLGEEGPTENPEIIARRRRQVRNFIATLFVSQGTPMISHGDELGRTQLGNNNAYCQDNELSWIDWDRQDRPLCEFVQRLVQLRAAHPVLRRTRWFADPRGQSQRRHAVRWYGPSGEPMTDEDWTNPWERSLAMVLDGSVPSGTGPDGQELYDDALCVLFNAHLESVELRVPPSPTGEPWQVLVDTADEAGTPADQRMEPGSVRTLRDLSMLIARIDRLPGPPARRRPAVARHSPRHRPGTR
jgi:isoamylase